MNKTVAYNNSVVFLARQYDKPIAGCLGFDVRRTNLKSDARRTKHEYFRT
jgi:hypothetical protein